MKRLMGLVMIAALIGPSVQAQEDQILFDDFDYEAYDDPLLSHHGWIVRTEDGWPGVPGAIWRAENVSFVDDPDDAHNRVLQMASSTDGSDTYQTQVCHQRKYYEGTYASRVYFSDAPTSGPDGDNLVQTFYLISPQAYDLDPDYSELDYEYLPNGGWGENGSVLFATSWETFRLEPWLADNTSDLKARSFKGWHTLVIQVADGTITYFVDGKEFALHGDEYYPEVPMSINFNHWFINGGLIDSGEPREYIEQVDWVFFVADSTLSPEEIDAQVEALRDDGVTFMDSVPDWEESPCNF